MIPEKISIDAIQVHDNAIMKEFIKDFKFKDNDILLADRGYLDYDFTHELKSKNISMISPCKKGSNLLLDALSLISVPTRDRDKKIKKKMQTYSKKNF